MVCALIAARLSLVLPQLARQALVTCAVGAELAKLSILPVHCKDLLLQKMH